MKRTLFSVLLLGMLCGFVQMASAVTPAVTYVWPIPAGCAGTYPVMNFTASGAPTTYSITWAGSPAGLPDVAPGTSLPSTGIPIVTMPNLAAGTYTGSFVVTNTSGSSAPVSITLTVNGLPAAYPVTGGGGLCAGAPGFHISLTNSEGGIQYQLMRSGSPVGTPLWGAVGVPVDFGAFNTAGLYTVTATNAGTGCTRNMTGAATITVYPTPVLIPVTGGGGYCAGGAGLPIGLSGSVFGTVYQLMRGGVPVGSPIAGAGTSIDFGAQTTAGIYTVLATDTLSPFCPASMTGSATIVVYPTPDTFTVTGGGAFCIGGYGVHVGLTNSHFGINYKLFRNGIYTSIVLPGTGLPLDFGLQTLDGVYTATAMNASYGCTANMVDSAIVSYLPVVTPTLSMGASKGTTICYGTVDSFYANAAFPGPTPTFTWKINGAFAGYGSSLVYTPADRDNVTVTMNSTATCAVPNVLTTTSTVTVKPSLIPTVVVSASPINVVNGSNDTITAIIVNGGVAPTYQWYVNNVIVAGATSRIFVSDTFKDGDVVTFKAQGCADSAGTASVTVHVMPKAGIGQISSNGGNILIYPNPGKGSFVISGDMSTSTASEQVTVTVTDLAGRVVYQANTIAANGKINEHVALSVSSGVYIVNLRATEDNVISRIVVE